MKRFLSLASGSSANCYCFQNDDFILILDAGIGFRTIKSRLSASGADISAVKLVLVSHDHVDHIKGLGSLAERLSVPVYATAYLHDALSRHYAVGDSIGGSKRVLKVNTETLVQGVSIYPFEVPHDAHQTLGYALDFFSTRIVVMTDLGYIPRQALDFCREADYVIIEANYDLDMLERGPYPADLKSRIRGNYGHLSNPDCAEAVATFAHPGLKAVFLCHLSKENNLPGLALKAVNDRLGPDCPFPIHALPRSEVFEWELL